MLHWMKTEEFACEDTFRRISLLSLWDTVGTPEKAADLWKNYCTDHFSKNFSYFLHQLGLTGIGDGGLGSGWWWGWWGWGNSLGKLFTENTGGHISWSVQVHGTRVSLRTLSTLSSPLLSPKFPLKRPYLGYGGPHSRSGCIDLEVTWQAAPADSKSFPPLNLAHTQRYLPSPPLLTNAFTIAKGWPGLGYFSNDDWQIILEEEEVAWRWSRDTIWVQRTVSWQLPVSCIQCKVTMIIMVIMIYTITVKIWTTFSQSQNEKEKLELEMLLCNQLHHNKISLCIYAFSSLSFDIS